MNTDNSDQIEATGNAVTNFLVPPVHIKSCLAGMCFETTDTATAEVKPKEHIFYENRIKIHICL